jgi:hypothetical protein
MALHTELGYFIFSKVFLFLQKIHKNTVKIHLIRNHLNRKKGKQKPLK